MRRNFMQQKRKSLAMLSGLLSTAACLQGAGQDDNHFHADRRASSQGQIPLGRLHSLAHARRQRPGQCLSISMARLAIRIAVVVLAVISHGSTPGSSSWAM